MIERPSTTFFPDLTACLDETSRPWVDSRPGVRTQLLRVQRDTGTWVIRNRFTPGFQSATHRHTGGIHAFTTTGFWRYREYDFVAGPGSYVHEQAGSVHTLVIPEENETEVEIAFVIDGGNIDYAPDGTIIGTLDGALMYEHYLRRCEEQGFGQPEGILV